jgi:hypothetical protein
MTLMDLVSIDWERALGTGIIGGATMLAFCIGWWLIKLPFRLLGFLVRKVLGTPQRPSSQRIEPTVTIR